MAASSGRPPVTGSAFIRLLAALNDLDTPAGQASFAQGLSGWVDWRDAIGLSSALNSGAAAAPVPAQAALRPPAAGAGGLSPAQTEERACLRLRQTLAKAIAEEGAAPAVRGTARGRPAPAPQPPPPEAELDFAPHRLRYLNLQQTMETQIEALRRRVRATLAAASPEMARLAALDAVMQEIVGAQERVLLASVPQRLAQRFEQLRRAQPLCAHEQAATEASAPALAPAAWRERFCQEVRALQLAELDLRLQPIEGLLAALRRSTTDRHE